MPSTYTGSGIELIGDGEQSGSWGDTTNNNLEIIDRLTSQAGTISLSGTTHTLSLSDGTLSDGQYAVLVFSGSPTGTNTVTINPNDAERVFIVRNISGEDIILTQGSGGNVTVKGGKTGIVYCDGNGTGAAVVDVSSDFITGRLEAIGDLSPNDGNFIVGNGSTWVAESGNTVLESIGVTATATELNVLDGITVTTAQLNNPFPSGGIVLWSGNVGSIPSGWYLCDGNNGTPNLTDRFVVGAGGSYSVGNTGGSASVTLTEAQLPSHRHSFSDSGTTNTTGSHSHTIQGNIYVGNGSYTGEAPSTYGANYYTNGNSTRNAGDHSHTFSVSGNTSYVGSGDSHENRPPYYALAYIMKA